MQRSWRPAVWIVAAAAILRLGFVFWAPRELSGDGFHYHLSAVALHNGSGYSDFDGSPSIRWMPGWPYLLAALYRVFGIGPWAPMLLNAALGALTAGGLFALGKRWFGVRAGIAAGGVYALWPGNIYYVATLMTEPLFNALLVACWLGLDAAGRAAGGRGWLGLVGAAVVFGAMAMVKAEPLVLIPVALGSIAATFPRSRALAAMALFAAVVGLMLAPWIIRNYRAFDRVVLTTATGGANAWLGNHEGASGGQSIVEMREFMKRHDRPTTAERLFAASDTGWSEAARFVRENPREQVAIWVKKLLLTYGGDADGARLVRGVGVGRVGFISETRLGLLAGLANLYWFGVVALVAIGLSGARAGGGCARWFVFGVPLCWVAVHLVFLGGTRFHVPETPAFALIAGVAIDRWVGGRRATGTTRTIQGEGSRQAGSQLARRGS